MKAEKIEGITVGGERTALAKVVPLQTPFLVQIFPVYGCNFRCNYCIHSVPKTKRNFVSDTVKLDISLHQKCIDDLQQFPTKVKMLRYAATGEPLLHGKIIEMIRYAKDANVADSVDIVTNGSLLTPMLSDGLVGAGLDWLRVSVQGMDSAAYKKIAQVKFDFEKLVENLTYAYNNRGDTKIFIKTIDIDLSEEDKNEFYSLFGNISDKIAIDQLSQATSHIDYSKLSSKELTATQHGGPVINAQVCPQPFYMIQLNPDGNFVPCCAMETVSVLGNVNQQSIVDVWNGSKMREFQKMMLMKEKHKNGICANCEVYKYGMFPSDVLDDDVQTILDKLNQG